MFMFTHLSFDDFIASHATNSCLAHSDTARYIYENIIWNDDIRIAMAEMSDANKPAIMVSGAAIEHHCASVTNCDLDLQDLTIRRTIGRMNSVALEPLGYAKSRFTPLPKNNPCNIFKSGSVFTKSFTGTQEIKKTIVNNRKLSFRSIITC